VLLIKSGPFSFGAYLSHPLLPSGAWMGSPASFMFSVSLDTRIPYHGRVPPKNSTGATAPKAFFADRNHIEVGNGDLYLDQGLSQATSDLEGCYGIGFLPGSGESKCFLAGSPQFDVDELEVWSI
jgi:hypothetical protein